MVAVASVKYDFSTARGRDAFFQDVPPTKITTNRMGNASFMIRKDGRFHPMIPVVHASSYCQYCKYIWNKILSEAAKKKNKKRRHTVSQLANRVDTNRQGQEGVAWISWIVEGLWGCGVEVNSASNDDGVDAIILLKRRPGLASYAGPTGDLIFAQIKTGYVDGVPDKDYSIPFDADKLNSWRSRAGR